MSDPFDNQKPPPAPLAAAFVDVRRAFRLLWAYHRRQLDMLSELDQSFRRLGLHYESWKPTECSRPSRGAPFAPGKWAWDMLPGMRVEVVWRGKRGSRDVQAVVWMYADETWEWPGHEPDPALWSVSAEHARSVLWVEVIEGPRGSDFVEITEWLEEHDTRGEEEITLDSGHYRAVTVRCDLDELGDQAALWDRVLRPVTTWWGDAGP